MTEHTESETVRKVQAFLDELSALSKRTGIVVGQRYDSVVLHIGAAGRSGEPRARYVVERGSEEEIHGEFYDLRWTDPTESAQRTALEGLPGARGVIAPRKG